MYKEISVLAYIKFTSSAEIFAIAKMLHMGRLVETYMEGCSSSTYGYYTKDDLAGRLEFFC